MLPNSTAHDTDLKTPGKNLSVPVIRIVAKWTKTTKKENTANTLK